MIHDIPLDPTSSTVRLDTLVRLRWLAIAGQTAAIALVAFGFGYTLPILTCLAVIGLSVGLNAYLWWRFPRSKRISERWAAQGLAFDLVQLAALLFLTGGLANPFSVLLLAPVLISATILRLPTTVALGVFASLIMSALAIWHLPLPWEGGEPPVFPLIYRLGVWASLLVAIAFICTYAWRVSDESRDLATALAATELALEREQRLSDLDGLAAAAAHELGTPLGTITVVAKELSRSVEPQTPLGEDIALIQAQAERCRSILGKLSSLGVQPDAVIATKGLAAVLDDLVAPHRDFSVPIKVATAGPDPSPMLRANPALTYGIGNLIENAVDFAASTVRVSGLWDDDTVRIVIDDDGPGFAPDVLPHLGEPYLSRRRARAVANGLGQDRALAGGALDGGLGGGLGLGFFIAKTLLERAGATVGVRNGHNSQESARTTEAAESLGGAVVTVSFPRHLIDTSGAVPSADATEPSAGASSA